MKMFAPDVMSWYLDLPIMPMVHVEGRTGCLIYRGEISDGQQIIAAEVAIKQLVELVSKSGALEKSDAVVSEG
jgi:hypothetical protein